MTLINPRAQSNIFFDECDVLICSANISQWAMTEMYSWEVTLLAEMLCHLT